MAFRAADFVELFRAAALDYLILPTALCLWRKWK
jgi:hypothetical protein